MWKFVLFIISSSFSTLVLATSFQPITIKQQLVESDGVVEGEVVNLIGERNEQGEIHTKVTLMANNWIGVKGVESGFVDIYYPGGSLDGESKVFHGSPNFKMGEKVFLMTRNYKGKSWVQGLGLGKFSLKNVGRDAIVVNQIFPGHPNVGQMSLKRLKKLAVDVKNTKFHSRFKDKYELYQEKQARGLTQKKISRGIASQVDEVSKEKPEKLQSHWLVLILGLLGLGASFIRKKKHD